MVRFWGILVATFVVLAVVCGIEPPLGDGWGHWFEAHATPLTWDRFATLARAYHEHGNPRWGQLPLALSFHGPWIGALVSPLMIVLGLYATTALVRGRRPDPRDPRDAALLVRVLAIAIVTTPQVGAVWFYRPICTNYIYPLALQLAWLVPYRFLAARAPGTRVGSLALAAAIVPLGLLAGAGNEHTGPGLALAAAIAMVIAARRDRALPVWAVTGLAALIAGYLFLLAAPGQQVRYAGLAAHQDSLVAPLLARGAGNLRPLGLVATYACPMLILLALAAGQARARWRSLVTREVVLALALAAALFATALASPLLPARLFVATTTFVGIALALASVRLEVHARASRWLSRISAAIAVAFFGAALVVHIPTGLEGRARVARLAAAAPGSVVHVAPYTFARPGPFAWGDDFRAAALRARIAEMLGLLRIDYDE